MEFSTGGGQVLESSKDVREPGRKGDLGGGEQNGSRGADLGPQLFEGSMMLSWGDGFLDPR